VCFLLVEASAPSPGEHNSVLATVQVSWWWKETETAIPVISTVMMRICWEISKQILWKK